jgi:hypothetical protein
VRLTVVENDPFLMLVVLGIVILVVSKAPSMAAMTINPFILVILAVITTEVNPDNGAEMLIIGVV